MASARGTLRYPVFLSDPAYHLAPDAGDDLRPYHSFLRYASSIGTAAGTDLDGATGRAVDELVEHDALSLAMLRWFVAGDGTLDLVDLPAALHGLRAEASAAAPGRRSTSSTSRAISGCRCTSRCRTATAWRSASGAAPAGRSKSSSS